ncbi:MAG TPA: hypothetical protein VM680_03220 [Verrucomicrobiae bacterium]|nr:hypothetical protein [Verrucomicrobiae bacterium]
MTPDKAKAHEKAVEALIGASLRAPDKETEITEQEIDRYVSQGVTLRADDKAALDKSKPALFREIAKILEENVKTQPASEARNVVPLPITTHTGGSVPFVEAVLIAQLTRLVATQSFPLGRLRYNKMAYFAHRKVDDDVNSLYLKKAAGPYSPWAKYQGPEKIAKQNGYVVWTKAGGGCGFLPGPKIDRIDTYVARYPVCQAVPWVVNRMRYKRNEDLELFATVDFAVLDLRRQNKRVTVVAIKQVIETNAEWAPKLERKIFSDFNISRALAELRELFPATYCED